MICPFADFAGSASDDFQLCSACVLLALLVPLVRTWIAASCAWALADSRPAPFANGSYVPGRGGSFVPPPVSVAQPGPGSELHRSCTSLHF